MLKSENGEVQLKGDVNEVVTDFTVAASILFHVIQRDLRMSSGQAKVALKEAVDVGAMSAEELKRRCIEEMIEREGGACDGCGGKGSCRCGTDEADS